MTDLGPTEPGEADLITKLVASLNDEDKLITDWPFCFARAASHAVLDEETADPPGIGQDFGPTEIMMIGPLI